MDISSNIIKKAKTESLSAFEEIMFIFEKPIFSYLLRLTQHKQTAEDLTQETFIKLYRNIKNLDENQNFKAYLYAIATNTAKDFWRKQKNKKEILIWEETELETFAPQETYYELEIDINSAMLEKALYSIKKEYRIVLLLFYQKQLSYKEIAENLNIPINSVKTYLFRAKKALAESAQTYV